MSFWIIALGYGHDLAECSGNDTLALLWTGPHHGMGFSTSCLPIGKNSAVISIKDIIYKRESTLFIN